MEKVDKIIYYLVVLIIVFVIGYISGYSDKKSSNNINSSYIDTLYNKIILDSIEYNIIKKDSNIYELKTKMKNEIEKSYILNDSNAVKLFECLVRDYTSTGE